jgi:hypothetical protein
MVLSGEFMSIFEFNLTTLELTHNSDGGALLINHGYPEVDIYLDKLVVEYLKKWKTLIELNNYFLLIDEGEKQWRIPHDGTPESGVWGHSILSGNLIKEGKKITCIEPKTSNR